MDGTSVIVGLWALVFCGAVAGLAAAVVLGLPALAVWWRSRADRRITAATRPTRHVTPRRRHV